MTSTGSSDCARFRASLAPEFLKPESCSGHSELISKLCLFAELRDEKTLEVEKHCLRLTDDAGVQRG